MYITVASYAALVDVLYASGVSVLSVYIYIIILYAMHNCTWRTPDNILYTTGAI